MISVVHPPPATNWGNRAAPSPPTPNEISGSGNVSCETLTSGTVLKFRPVTFKPRMEIGLAETTDKVPENSAGIEVWIEIPAGVKNSVINLEICWCGAMVKIVVPKVVPSDRSSVIVTTTKPLFGLTSATPVFSENCVLTSTGKEMVVVKTGGRISTSSVSVACFILRSSKAVNPVAFGDDGVTMA